VASRPGAARAAVMVDPAPMIMTDEMRGMVGNVADASEGDTDGSFRRQFVEGMFLPTDSVRRDEIIDGMTATPPKIAGAAIRSLATFDARAALGSCSVPLLTIGSAVPTNRAADLVEACGHIVVGQTVGSGHFNQLEVPEQVNLMIEHFLATSL
jgi:pimeloyl-ACP methyl ester carboxylesterase